MKSFKPLLALVALGIAALPLIGAQDAADATTPPAEGRRGKGGKEGQRGPDAQGRGQMMNPEARVAQLDRTLGLTADQKTKLTDIFAKSREEMQGLRGGGGDRKANREQMQQMMQATRDQVQAVLTDVQKKKFEEMEQPGRGGSGERPKGGQGKRKKDA